MTITRAPFHQNYFVTYYKDDDCGWRVDIYQDLGAARTAAEALVSTGVARESFITQTIEVARRSVLRAAWNPIP